MWVFYYRPSTLPNLSGMDNPAISPLSGSRKGPM
jgi:hypothetical protein